MVRASRRRALGLIAALAACSVLPAAAQTTSFPSRPIRLIVPHTPGGNSDTFGRILALKLSERMYGHAFVTRVLAVHPMAGVSGPAPPWGRTARNRRTRDAVRTSPV